jgi:hypothetical protein
MMTVHVTKTYHKRPRLEDGKWQHGPINFALAHEKAGLHRNIALLSQEAERHERLRKEAERLHALAKAEAASLREWLGRIANPSGGDVGASPARMAQMALNTKVAK